MACENPRCTMVPLTQPPLHIADEDPIPEEQVRMKIAFFPSKELRVQTLPPFLCN